MMNNKKAFTLIELMVVVVLIGIIAGFALPNYQKTIRKAHERDAVVQLTALHAANLIYYAQSEAYLAGDGGLTHINTNLGINIIANEMDYYYNGGGGTSYTATATWDDPGGPANDFTVQVDQTAIEEDINPCCYAGDCPSLDVCL